MSKESILQNLHFMLGHTHDSPRLEALRSTLQPTFAAMPKNAKGGLDHRVARYALHRYFMVQHAWHIKGLSVEPKLEENTASLTALLQSKMPDIVLGMLEGELKGDKIGLDELVVVAASIEDLVQSDTVELLQRAYKVHGFSTSADLRTSEANLVIRTFTLWFVIPSLQDWTRENVLKAMKNTSNFYPGWDDTMLWVQDLQHASDYTTSAGNPFQVGDAAEEPMSFDAMGQWAMQVTGGFGRFSDVECKEMKGRLLEMDDFAEGRVRLGKYYSQALHGASLHFSESPEYLRHLGALDESTKGQSSVIIPNILYARSNCLANSGFHSVCCMDDCQVLMSEVEQAIASPSADPSALLQVVSGLSSESVAGPRELPQHLRLRLDEIAARNSGSVPLHGRLFAQWMHYAFPNECPYPSSLLTSETPMSSLEWVNHWNRTKSTAATTEEMQTLSFLLEQQEANSAAGLSGNQKYEDQDTVLWSDEEQLLDDSGFKGGRGVLWEMVRTLAMVAAVCATGISLFQQHNYRLLKATLESTGRPDVWEPKQHLV